ncbi:hypothetical protein CDAR_24321 [Caerostris darwini]|uniref:Uncharacterized protein n=1 Tax=Caerostris darwini TaxID=1538125 RepID=A0AAV4QGB3_9ARAC|nr:hypothetical protein CDAR_24321 [Caerostris darwini]
MILFGTYMKCMDQQFLNKKQTSVLKHLQLFSVCSWLSNISPVLVRLLEMRKLIALHHFLKLTSHPSLASKLGESDANLYCICLPSQFVLPDNIGA